MDRRAPRSWWLVPLAALACGSDRSVGFNANGDRGVLLFEDSTLLGHDLLVQVTRQECFEGCGGLGDCGRHCEDDDSLDWSAAMVAVTPEPVRLDATPVPDPRRPDA